MSQFFDLRHGLNSTQRCVLRAKAKRAGVSMAEYIRQLVRACANDELLEFIPESEIRTFIHNIDFGDD